jgi:hypothetical protein
MPDEVPSSRFAPIVAVVMLLLAGVLVPARTESRPTKSSARHERRVEHRSKKADVQLASNRDSVDLSAYRDLGSWIDIYDAWPWAHPTLAVRKLHDRGARTIFLQTSNYGAKDPIFRPRQTARFLKAAHARDMEVVAWTVPSFANPQKDYHRARAAILFKGRGHRFDSFGLDIEAAIVSNIWRRNKRLLDLSKQLRDLVGPDYPLGAITPDPVKSLYWPNFPYQRVDRLYDVFVPMGYFSFRAHGYKDVKRYTEQSIRVIRRESGDPDVPIHLIGGIGGETEPPEVKGFVRAVKGHGVLGASYYDFAVTSEHEWKQLETIVQDPKPTPTPTPSEAPPAPEVRPTALTTPVPAPEKEQSRDKKSKGDKKDGNRKKNGKHNKRDERNDKRDGRDRQGKDRKKKRRTRR